MALCLHTAGTDIIFIRFIAIPGAVSALHGGIVFDVADKMTLNGCIMFAVRPRRTVPFFRHHIGVQGTVSALFGHYSE